MFEILTSKNKYNYTIKQIIIDYEKKEFLINFGGASKIAKKNSTTKKINEKIEELKILNFKQIKGV